jgi:hypothetical protein
MKKTDLDSPRRRPLTVLSLGLIMATSVIAASEQGEITNAPPPPKYSPSQRMALVHLQSAHADVIRLGQNRKSLPPYPGLTDYRAILHAHAEDSAHTGGNRPEMLADAKRAEVHAILLTDHHRPPKDFVTDTWRGLHDGVLFIPGSEDRGFLLYPTSSIMTRMQEPTPTFVDTVKRNNGLIFLSHIEERPNHSMHNLDGMEITNRHADAKVDKAGILTLMLKLTDPTSLAELAESLRLYPDELFASQARYPTEYLAKWDAETKSKRLTGVAANDCHHNQVLIVKMVDNDTVRVGTNVDADDGMRKISATLRPGIRALTKNHKPGDVLARIDIDPYYRSFHNMSTHILAPELTEPAIRAALQAGKAYVSQDWMCDPTGFRFTLLSHTNQPVAIMGDEVRFASDPSRLSAHFPLECHIRLLKSGQPIAEAQSDHIEHTVTTPGVYRVEAWLKLDGEERPWIYSNPIYIR